MKKPSSWNRRDFIVKPMAALAATQLLGGLQPLLAQTAPTEAPAAKPAPGAPPMVRTLGKTGIRLPIVSMGVMNADVPGLIKRSFELGIRHFDTAANYQGGRNETMVGNMIQELGVRDQVIISTKVHHPSFFLKQKASGTEPEKRFTDEEVHATFLSVFEGSLKRLQMDHVDILYNHSCDTEADAASPGAVAALLELKKAGKTRFIGVSSHKPEAALRAAMKLGYYDVVLIQFNYTMANDDGLRRAIDEAAAKGIGIVAMKTQAGGATRPDPKLGKPLTPASQTALLKWVLRHEGVTTAIPGVTRYDQLEQNFEVAANLGYTLEEKEFLGNKEFAAEAQFCRQCGQCRPDCPQGVNIPQLMRSHMYTVQYGNHALAAETLATIERGKGLAACSNCESCQAACRNAVNIARKIQHLKEIASIGQVEA